MMNWMNIWIKLFGTAEYLGLNVGFWVSMVVVALIVVLMNVVFWKLRARKFDNEQ